MKKTTMTITEKLKERIKLSLTSTELVPIGVDVNRVYSCFGCSGECSSGCKGSCHGSCAYGCGGDCTGHTR